jgi:hypothetical protein
VTGPPRVRRPGEETLNHPTKETIHNVMHRLWKVLKNRLRVGAEAGLGPAGQLVAGPTMVR